MRYLPVLFLFFLTACGNASGNPAASDPYTVQGASEGSIRGTEAAVEQARMDVEAAIKKDDKLTQNEIRRLMAPIEAAERQLELDKVRAVETDTWARATSTQKAADATALYNAAMATSTQTAYQHNQLVSDAIDFGWVLFYACLLGGVTGAVIYLAYWFLRRAQDNIIERDKAEQEHKRELLKIERMKLSVRTLPDGKVCWYDTETGPVLLEKPKNGRLTVLESGTSRQLVDDGFIPLEDAGTETNDINKLALDLVMMGIKKWGEFAFQLPGYRLMNWAASKWDRVIKILKAADIADTVGGQQTFLKEGGPYSSLRMLYDALESGELILSSATPPPYPASTSE